jgi:hypothetical protein
MFSTWGQKGLIFPVLQRGSTRVVWNGELLKRRFPRPAYSELRGTEELRLAGTESTALIPFRENDVCCVWRGDVSGAIIAKLYHVDTSQQMFPRSKKHRRNRKVQFVNKLCVEVLLDRGDAAAEPDVSSIGSRMSKFQDGVNPIGDERSSLHPW